MEIKAVLIDIDDTLLDFDAYVKESMKTGFQKFGFPPFREEMYQVFLGINTQLWGDLEKGILTFQELKSKRWSMVLEALNIDFDGNIFENYFR
ncbi:MAG: HAD family hydrolase, partial [Clostridia bacterium]|nr:HAD family hydrolase [Clostridia bacterium]